MTDASQAIPTDTILTTHLKKLTDGQRLKLAVRNHGLALLAAVTLWAAADAWLLQSNLLLASSLAVLNAFAAMTIAATIFHEWGHFIGARLAKSYSPRVPDPRGTFIFGFNFAKNTRHQFLAMSIGGSVANWLLVLIVATCIPLDNAGRIMLFAVAVARGISVLMFEVPIMLGVMNGGEPEAELNKGESNGSGDRGQAIGYGIGALIWLVAL
ncbi:MAG: hypothetical protein ACI8PP_003028 [Candidatus Pseudothioglobus sp.]|jgi:hypothetical protein